MSWPILSVTIFLPLVGALFLMTLRGDDEAVQRNARWIALWTTLITFAVSLVMVWRFDSSSAEFQFVERQPWLGGAITYHIGVDGISLPFVILTTGIMPLCIISSFRAITRRVKEFMIAFLVLETLMVGTFSALDLVLFYLFFEGGLIPMFLIIGIWGGPRRVYASFKFFLYTFLGSVLMLLAIMAMYWSAGTTDIATLVHHEFPRSLQNWAWFAFLASFAVKLPMWPVHTWLPDAHVEAPTAGSVILAAILLKLGGYGFLRFSLPMFPLASQEFAPLIFALSVIAITYTALVALVQVDMKKVIAYSSVAHMGFVTMGIFAGTMQGIAGGVFQMISHGLVSGALFLCVGVVYDRMHTHETAAFGGLVNARQCRTARHYRLHRRVPVADRHVQDQHLGRELGGVGADHVGLLRPVALSQGGVRQAREAGAGPYPGPQSARNHNLRAAADPHDSIRHLSQAGAGHVGRVGDGTDGELSAQPSAQFVAADSASAAGHGRPTHQDQLRDRRQRHCRAARGVGEVRRG
jgi:NADH-quinone oxidoreductase subunit M